VHLGALRGAFRPRLGKSDRAFRLVLTRLWSRWAEVLVVVKPDTVVRWHRAGFRFFWRWKSHSRSPAESDVSAEVKALIRQMAELLPKNCGFVASRGRRSSSSPRPRAREIWLATC
jgi:hypothetical protein